jgi:hypothetical protein
MTRQAHYPEPPEIYTNRLVRSISNLDASHRLESTTTCMGTLDAPEQLPSGSMRQYGREQSQVLQRLCSRPDLDRPVENQEARVESLLKQLRQPRTP